ncbi:MAG: DUF3576 domain-containing protein [Rhodobacteraceae bacterium]|nr:DUF3576 domain-containing protein [Paracoccaceae bacterium]
MILHRISSAMMAGVVLFGLSACGGGLASGDSGLFNRGGTLTEAQATRRERALAQRAAIERSEAEEKGDTGSKFFDLFTNAADPNTTVEVNKYLWQASLEVLNFLPIESVDPFTGVIVTGYGTPPGGGRAYRATVYVQDPALDARSLRLALQTRGGAVSAETSRAIEDAILTRARQLRIRDAKL